VPASGAAAAQLATAQRDLAGARAEISRLSDSVQGLERDRNARVAQLQQENAAISARLRQAQGTLDQIASAARLINSGSVGTPVASLPPVPTAGAGGNPLSGAAPGPQMREHTVAERDSLTGISERYYGTRNRWQEIYEANRDTLTGQTALRPGQRLRIP